MKKIKETEKGFYGCYWPVERIGADRYRPSYHTGCGCVENRIIQDKKNRQAGGRCYYVNRDRGCRKKIWQRRE